MKKRIFMLLLALALLLTLLPATALAEGWDGVTEGGVGFNYGSGFIDIAMPTITGNYTYGTAAGGTAAGGTAAQTASDASTLPATGWNWAVQKHAADANNVEYTLTLKDFNISYTGTADALMFKCNLNLVLRGENVITAPQSGTALSGLGGSLYISGDGRLEAAAGCGIGCEAGALTISENVTVTATGSVTYGIDSGGSVNISGNAAVTATTTGLYGIKSITGVNISGGTVNASGNQGIYADGSHNITITGGTVIAQTKLASGGAPFNKQPVLAGYTGGYQWKAAKEGTAYTQSAATPYALEASHAYVEIKPAMGTPPTLNATVAPTSASYDKGTATAGLSFTLNSGSYTLNSIYSEYSRETLTEGTDYTVSGNVYTVKQSYLDRQGAGSARAMSKLVFSMSGGTDPKAEIYITDSAPVNATVTPATVGYNKRTATAGLSFALDYPGSRNALFSIGMPIAGSVTGMALVKGVDYTVYETVNGCICTINKSWLDAQPQGELTLWFGMNRGSALTVAITITDEQLPAQSGGGDGGYTTPAITLYNDPSQTAATVWLTGSGLTQGDMLIAERSNGGAYDALRKQAGGAEVLSTYNIYLRSGKKSTGSAMYLTFGLDAKYASQPFTLVHQKADGSYEYFYATADGNHDLKFGPLYELSPFMLVKGTISQAQVTGVADVPKTGDASSAGCVMLAAAGLAGVALLKRRREQP